MIQEPLFEFAACSFSFMPFQAMGRLMTSTAIWGEFRYQR